MNSWKIILATILIFGAGVITGGLLVNHVDRDNTPKTAVPAANANTNAVPNAATVVRRDPPAGMEQRRLDFLRKVSSELNLSPEQKERVEAILHDSQEKIHKLWEAVAPKMREEMTNAPAKIAAELTLDQRQKFEELLKRPPPRRNNETNAPSREIRRPTGENSTNKVVGELGTPAKQTP